MAETSPTSEVQCRKHYFPFFELPPELRVMIYEMALVESEPIQLTTFYDDDLPVLSRSDFRNLVAGTRLLQADRQIRAEALPIFYSRNTFVTGVFNMREMVTAFEWLQSIGMLSRTFMEYVAVHESEWTEEMYFKESFSSYALPDPFLPGSEPRVTKRIHGTDYRMIALDSIDFDT